MSTLYTPDGKPVQVPDGETLQALASGKFQAKASERIPVVLPDGSVGTIPPERAGEALAQGARSQTSEELRAEYLQKEYGGIGSQLGAVGLGAVRGVSFGLSDVIGSAAGYGKEIGELKEAQPLQSTLGEIGGVIGSLGVGGAAKAGAKAGGIIRGATAAPRMVARVGKAVEEGTAKLLGVGEGFAGKALAKAASTGAGSAVEGALYGAGQYISESSLGDIDATAENLIGSMGVGAVLGGGLSAGLGLGGSVIAEAGRGARRMAKSSAKGLVDLWERQTGNKALPGLSDAFAKISGGLTGKMAETETLFGKGGFGKTAAEARTIAAAGEGLRDKGAKELAEHYQEMMRSGDEILDLARGESKKKFTAELLAGQNPEIMRAATSDIADRIIGQTDEMLARGPFEYGYQPEIRRINEFAKSLKSKAELADEDVVRLFGEADELKRDVGKSLRRKAYREGAPSNDLDTVKAFKNLYEDIRKPLEDSNVWGKRVSQLQKEDNAAWVQHLEDIKRRSDHPFVKSWETTDWKMKHEAIPYGFRSYIDDMGSLRNAGDEPWIAKQIQTRQNLLDSIAKNHELTEGQLALVESHRKAMKSFLSTEAELKKSIGIQNQLESLTKASKLSGISAGLGGTIGAVVGGVPGAAIGSALGAMLNPAQLVRPLASIQRLATTFRTSLESGVSSYIEGFDSVSRMAGRVGRRLVAPTSSATILRKSLAGKRDDEKEDRHTSYNLRMAELRDLISNPDKLDEQLAKATAGLAPHAPQLANAISTQAVKAAQYLHDSAPKNPAPPSYGESRWKPSESELQSWARRVEVAQDPRAVTRQLKEGTLSREAMETLQAIYPKIHEQLVGAIVDKLATSKVKPSYSELAQLSQITGAVLDPSSDPQFVRAIQGAHVAMRPTPQNIGRRPQMATRFASSKGSMTETQRLEFKA